MLRKLRVECYVCEREEEVVLADQPCRKCANGAPHRSITTLTPGWLIRDWRMLLGRPWSGLPTDNLEQDWSNPVMGYRLIVFCERHNDFGHNNLVLGRNRAPIPIGQAVGRLAEVLGVARTHSDN